MPDRTPGQPVDPRPNNLPLQPTLLIGREDDTTAACALLRKEHIRLLTLTGAGGTGKTRLGLQVASDLLQDFKDGVYFVSLAPISDPGPTVGCARWVTSRPSAPISLCSKGVSPVRSPIREVSGPGPLTAA